MVNFRFHLVSLTAVFLALAAGITIGAGVVDRATVDQIERQLDEVAKRREETNAENDRLSRDLARWGDFSKGAGDRLFAGQLTSTPIMVVATTGLDRGLVDGLRGALTAAGAEVDGTVWFTGRWALGGEEETRQLAGVLDAAPTTDPDDLRTAGLAGLSAAWSAGDGGALVTSMVSAGFLEYDPPAVETVPLVELPRPDTLFVVISGDSADVAPSDLAVPLVSRLAGAQLRVLAAQPLRPASESEKADTQAPPEFVAALRSSPVAGRISTVDNLDDYRGRVAAVLALRDLREGKTGHFGFGPDTRLVPEPPTP